MRSILPVFLLFLGFLLFPSPMPRAVNPGGILKKDPIIRIRISFTGDLMCHMPQVENARISGDSFDFRPCFAPVAEVLRNDDLSVGNFETTCAGKEQVYTGYPAFNTPDAFPEALHDAGFDFLGMANNHALDRGEAGLLRTLEVIRKNGLGYAGTYASQHDRDSVRVLSVKGFRLAILNYTYGTNGAYPSAEHAYMLSVIDTTQLKTEITRARAQGAEILALFLHIGEEMKSEPTPYQDSLIAFSIRAGADLIIGSHPHVIGPARFFKSCNAGADSGFIACSLGNFFSNQYWRYTDAGVIVTVGLEKNLKTGKIRIGGVDCLPTWVYRGTHPDRKLHIVFPAWEAANDTTIPFLDAEQRRKAREAWDDTRSMLEKGGDPRIRVTQGSRR